LVTDYKDRRVTDPVITGGSRVEYVAAMVTKGSKLTKIHPTAKVRLFLREHRKAKGVSATTMAGRLGIERESVYRLERELGRLDPEKLAQYAHALQIEPTALYSPPGAISLDALVADADEETRTMAADIVRRLVAGQR
jgi:DNA-binding XRE family transcriptional regulator